LPPSAPEFDRTYGAVSTSRPRPVTICNRLEYMSPGRLFGEAICCRDVSPRPGRPLGEPTETDLVEFAPAVGHRDAVHGRSFMHYLVALHESRTFFATCAPVTAAV